MLQGAGHTKNTIILIFLHIQCLHLMHFEIAWVLVSSGTQIQLQIILDSDYFPDYLSSSYGYVMTRMCGFTNSFCKVRTKPQRANNSYKNYNYKYGKFLTHQLYKCYKVFKDYINFKTKNKQKINKKKKHDKIVSK